MNCLESVTKTDCSSDETEKIQEFVRNVFSGIIDVACGKFCIVKSKIIFAKIKYMFQAISPKAPTNAIDCPHHPRKRRPTNHTKHTSCHLLSCGIVFEELFFKQNI